MKCPRCSNDEFEKIPYIDKDIKGIMLKCQCGHKMYEVKPKCPEMQKQLNEAFELKKQELSQ